MEQVHRSSIEADNRLRTLETDQRRLELYHQMLNNISTQATLLLGFSLATYAVDLMPKVLDDAGTFGPLLGVDTVVPRWLIEERRHAL